MERSRADSSHKLTQSLKPGVHSAGDESPFRPPRGWSSNRWRADHPAGHGGEGERFLRGRRVSGQRPRLPGAQREITGWLVKSGYTPAGRWSEEDRDDDGYSEWSRAFKPGPDASLIVAGIPMTDPAPS
jgi:hypothetical protein